MGFKVVVIGTNEDGDEVRTTIHETDDARGRVTKVHVLTRTGETATIGVDPDQGDMALTFDYTTPGQLHVSDLDNIKLGYEPNLTGEEAAAREEKLAEIRSSASVNDAFTQEAVDAQREAEEAAQQAERDEPVNPDDGTTVDEGTDKGELQGFHIAETGETAVPGSPGETPSPEDVPENRGESVAAEKGEAVPGFQTT